MKKLLCVLLVLLLVLSVNAGYADKKATDTVFIGEFTRLTLKRYLSMTAQLKICRLTLLVIMPPMPEDHIILFQERDIWQYCPRKI